MSTRKEKIPTVRFRAFSEPWFQNQLSEVAEFSKGRGYSKKDIQPQGTPIILYGRLYTKYESVISNIDTYANMEKNSVISEGGEVIIPASGESAAEISRASCVTDGGVILGGDINIVKPHESLDSSFIAITLSNGSQQRELSKRAQGKSVVHLHNSDLKAVKLFYPSYEEQFAIGSLFRNIDDLLASYKDNLANYRSLKTTMLSKMFPKAGQTVSEIRSDGFEGEWELLEINDLADDFQSGGTPKTNVQEYWDGDIPWIQSSDLETNCLFEIKVQKSISEKGLKNSSAKIIPKDSIAVVTRVGVGKLVVMRHEYATSQDFLSLSNLKSNIEFTAYLLYRLLQKEVTQLQGTSIKGITKVELLSKKVLIPSLLEQQAIGSYFSNLDQLITSYQEKITQLETLKKKLLQDMFI